MSKAHGHYLSKANCLKMIEKTILAEGSIKKNLIYYFAMDRFGFGVSQVDKLLEILKNAGIIEETEEGVLKNVL